MWHIYLPPSVAPLPINCTNSPFTPDPSLSTPDSRSFRVRGKTFSPCALAGGPIKCFSPCLIPLSAALDAQYYKFCICCGDCSTVKHELCEKVQRDTHFISFICFNYTILYMFRTNRFIIRSLLLYRQQIEFCILFFGP